MALIETLFSNADTHIHTYDGAYTQCVHIRTLIHIYRYLFYCLLSHSYCPEQGIFIDFFFTLFVLFCSAVVQFIRLRHACMLLFNRSEVREGNERGWEGEGGGGQSENPRKTSNEFLMHQCWIEERERVKETTHLRIILFYWFL